VKYWLTFNEINSVLHAPLMSGGIWTPKEQLSPSQLYQAIHHELVASASATRIAHEINPDLQVGCMVIAMPIYPLTPDPADVLAVMKADHENLAFGDVHVRGAYPGYFLRSLRRGGGRTGHHRIRPGDAGEEHGRLRQFQLLHEPVRAASGGVRTEGNIMGGVQNPTLPASEWGWQIDPTGCGSC
jgi:6-phospho-beta-glucosidase